MTAREDLKAALSHHLGKAWRTGIAYVDSGRLDDATLQSYPEEAGALAALMAAFDARVADEVSAALAGEGGGRFLKVPEIAAAGRVAPVTVYRAIEARELAAVRIGRSYRVREQDARLYLAGLPAAGGAS